MRIRSSPQALLEIKQIAAMVPNLMAAFGDLAAIENLQREADAATSRKENLDTAIAQAETKLAGLSGQIESRLKEANAQVEARQAEGANALQVAQREAAALVATAQRDTEALKTAAQAAIVRDRQKYQKQFEVAEAAHQAKLADLDKQIAAAKAAAEAEERRLSNLQNVRAELMEKLR